MTELTVHDEVRECFPEVSIVVVTALGADGTRPWCGAEDALLVLESRVVSGAWTPPADDDPRIAAWHAVYRRFGANPRRTRPSVDALCRRLIKVGRVPRVNGPVDAYNAVSIAFGVPIGAFDLDAVRGAVQLRTAAEGDAFVPLGKPDDLERPTVGEVVYADDLSVVTRCWNHRDADRTKVTGESRQLAFFLEAAQGPDGLPGLEAAADALTRMVEPHCAQVSSQLVELGGGVATTTQERR